MQKQFEGKPRFEPTVDGLRQVVSVVLHVASVAKRLPVLLASIWGNTEIDDRILMFKHFVTKVTKREDDASLARTIAYGVRLSDDMLEKLCEFFEYSVKVFEGTIEVIKSNSPQIYAENKDALHLAVASYCEAIGGEYQIEDLVEPYRRAHLLTSTLLMKSKEEATAQEREEKERIRREKEEAIFDKIEGDVAQL